MTSAYNALLTAKNSYDQALLKSQNAKESLAATERSVAVGAASARDLEDARYNASAEEINVSLSKYAMQKAYFSYCAYRDGLAGQG
jgi:outer membrane protein TolC